MDKINLSDLNSHPLAYDFSRLTAKVELLGTGPDFTSATNLVFSLQRKVEHELDKVKLLASWLGEIADMATTETDTGPVFNFSFLDDVTKAQRFAEILSSEG